MPDESRGSADDIQLVGTLLDIDTGARTKTALRYRDGRLVAVGEQDTTSPAIELGAELLIVPGFTDLHVHVFDGVGDGVDADACCLGRGTTTAVDAGSAGAATIGAFATIVRTAQTRIRAWLNISTVGLIDTRFGELIPGPYLDPGLAVAAARQHAGLIIGFKARLSTYAAGGGTARVLSALRGAADRANLPVMVHIGDTDETIESILDWLHAGDVVTHTLTGRKHGILDEQQRVRQAVIAAQRRGVLFDCARGGNHVSFRVLDAALDDGFLPDTLGSDMSAAVAGDPDYGQATLGTYLLAAGVELTAVLDRLSRRAATAIGLGDDARIEPGRTGDVTVIRVIDQPSQITDVDGVTRRAGRRIQAVGAVRAGRFLPLDRSIATLR